MLSKLSDCMDRWGSSVTGGVVGMPLLKVKYEDWRWHNLEGRSILVFKREAFWISYFGILNPYHILWWPTGFDIIWHNLGPSGLKLIRQCCILLTNLFCDGVYLRPSVLDNFALLSGQLNTINKLLKNDKTPSFRNQVIIPLLLSPDRDEDLAVSLIINSIMIFSLRLRGLEL